MAEDYNEAYFWFAHELSYDLEPKLEYVIDMVETYGYALINSGRAGEALFFENIYEEFGNSADFQSRCLTAFKNSPTAASNIALFI